MKPFCKSYKRNKKTEKRKGENKIKMKRAPENLWPNNRTEPAAQEVFPEPVQPVTLSFLFSE
jgi:hypothetical protein